VSEEAEHDAAPQLVRGLGAWDAALLTIGSILGTGIFITTGDIARVAPHAGLIIALWVAGGVLTLAGALTYAELGTLFPRAGGQYQFLKEAYGPLPGFLFGWGAFFVIMSGGIATLAVGFGEYLGAFVPFFSTRSPVLALPFGGLVVNGGQLAGALAIALLTAVNYLGLREGAGLQNFVTLVKIASLVGLAAFGLAVPATAVAHLTAPLPPGNLLAALGVGMIAVLWSFDGWYAATNVGSEMRRPERDLPLGLIAGTAAVTPALRAHEPGHVRALSVEEMARTPRIGEAAAQARSGPSAGDTRRRPGVHLRASPPRSCTPRASTCPWRRTGCSSGPGPHPSRHRTPSPASWPRAPGPSC
jgi:APA family basic amino acid/polyamine antiporter